MSVKVYTLMVEVTTSEEENGTKLLIISDGENSILHYEEVGEKNVNSLVGDFEADLNMVKETDAS